MSIIKLHTLIAILLSGYLSYSQGKKETIYIEFNPNVGDSCWTFNNYTQFSLNEHQTVYPSTRHQLNNFRFDSTKDNKTIVSYSSLQNKLITGREAIKKVENYLKDYPQRFTTPYYYNSYFEKIFMVKKINEDSAIVYEVEWNWTTN